MGIRQADLAAHDLGGMAAIGFVSRFPNRTRRLVIMDTAPYVDWPLFVRLVVKNLGNPIFAWLSLFRFQFKLTLKCITIYRKQAVTDEMVDLYLTPWLKDRDSRKAYRQAILVPPEKISQSAENIRRIQQPALILWAEKDRLFPIQVARRLKTDPSN